MTPSDDPGGGGLAIKMPATATTTQWARPGWSSGQNGFRLGDPVAAIEGQDLGQSATLEGIPETRLVAHLGERARRILKNVAGKTLSRQ